ncbi:hypothetical protein K530_22637 [Streptomyces noursei CCRC 11814]|nr:hypothetical protein K530_22637 [Streptomyces noursei CCRC 11814]
MAFQGEESRLAARRDLHFMATALQREGDALLYGGVVFDEQDSCHRVALFSGWAAWGRCSLTRVLEAYDARFRIP